MVYKLRSPNLAADHTCGLAAVETVCVSVVSTLRACSGCVKIPGSQLQCRMFSQPLTWKLQDQSQSEVFAVFPTLLVCACVWMKE